MNDGAALPHHFFVQAMAHYHDDDVRGSSNPPPPSSSSLTQEAIGGLSAGIIGTVIGFPLDTIKARQQVFGPNHNCGGGVIGTARHILQQEGFLSFYRGLVPPLLSLSILNTVNFTAYSYFQTCYKAERGWDLRNSMAGATVGPLASTISTVENLIKTQLQLDNATTQRYRGSLDFLRKVTPGNGRLHVPVLYTGHMVNTAREMTFLATYFGMYEGLRDYFFHYHGTEHPLAIPFAGGLAGAVAWTVSFPLDCVRAGVQGQDLMSRQRTPRQGGWTIFRTLLQTRGVAGLYSGVTPSIIRAFLVSGSRFTAYESALWFLRGGRDTTQ